MLLIRSSFVSSGLRQKVESEGEAVSTEWVYGISRSLSRDWDSSLALDLNHLKNI